MRNVLFLAVLAYLVLVKGLVLNRLPPQLQPLNTTLSQRQASYSLIQSYEGSSFFDGWNFWDADDPTHGVVDYLTRDEAFGRSLAGITSDGKAYMRVDNTNNLGWGVGRGSVRIESQRTYSGGLFILDAVAMPFGCAVWPAWWSHGPNWPNAGEIDVIETVNSHAYNRIAIHANEGCDHYGASGSGANFLGNTDCNSLGPTGNTGCGYEIPYANSAGGAFNAAGGGVYAHEWTYDGIKVWFWTRANIPGDILSSSPNPSSWGTPTAFFDGGSCSADHFYDHKLIFDITLCGDWAGEAYNVPGQPGASCPGASGWDGCLAAVQNPSNFNDAVWVINSVRIYSQ